MRVGLAGAQSAVLDVARPAGIPYFRNVILPIIRSMRARRLRPRVVFDIDNTLFDTRFRTMECVHRFGASRGIPALAKAKLQKIGFDGRDTATNFRVGSPGTELEFAL